MYNSLTQSEGVIMLKRTIEKHPVADFVAKFIVGFAFVDILLVIIFGLVSALHLM